MAMDGLCATVMHIPAGWQHAGCQACASAYGQEALTNRVCIAQDCLALGTIFATTDSVAVLQVLEQDRAPLLFSLVFGEGVVNDATTVALLRTVQAGTILLSRPTMHDWVQLHQ